MKKSIRIIAEVGTNHNGDLDTALKLIDVATECGADIVKFQSFWVEDLLPQGHPDHNRMKRLEIPRDWYGKLVKRCGEKGVQFLSTATSFTTLDWMEKAGAPMYKVASCNVTHRPLLERLVEMGKPLILSTGMVSLEELRDLDGWFRQKGFKDYAFLHCVSKYPTGPSDMRLKNINVLKENFSCPVGFSDHSLGIHIALAAAALGAEIIEKHISLNKEGIGLDHVAAILPEEFGAMCSAIRDIEKAIYEDFSFRPEEFKMMRRSLHFGRSLKAGEPIQPNDLKVTRPEDGLLPKEWSRVIGCILKKDVRTDEPVREELLGRS